MMQEDKELLLQDLGARLSYGVHCCVFNLNKTIKEDNDIIYGIVGDNIVSLKSDKNEYYMYYQIKPYLRPMSSMTEEEYKQYRKFSYYGAAGYRNNDYKEMVATPSFEKMDFLNAHHFDYRGLIEKGLALEAPEGMYK